MLPLLEHDWDLAPEAAVDLQKRLATKVIQYDELNHIHRVAGVDVAYDKTTDLLFASIVVMNAQSLEVIEKLTTKGQSSFPYIPGLFSFRELPPLIYLFAQINHNPDLIICDGQGLAHPRRFGLACHLGVLFDIPTIGCAKTKFLGEESYSLNKARGSKVDLIDSGEVIGATLRTQDNVNPVYVSIGHRISLSTACDWILALTPQYRLPEPIREADQTVRKVLRKNR